MAACIQGNQSKYFHPKSCKDPLLLKQLQEIEHPCLKYSMIAVFADRAAKMQTSSTTTAVVYLDGGRVQIELRAALLVDVLMQKLSFKHCRNATIVGM